MTNDHKKSYQRMVDACQTGFYPVYLSTNGTEFYRDYTHTPYCIKVIYAKNLWPSFEVAMELAKIKRKKRNLYHGQI